MEAILKLREMTEIYVPMKAVRNGLLLAVVGIGFCLENDAIWTVKSGYELSKPDVMPCCSGLADVSADEALERACKMIAKTAEKGITDTQIVKVPLEQKKITTSVPRSVLTDVITKSDRVAEERVDVPREFGKEVFSSEGDLKSVSTELSMKIILNGNGGMPETMEYSGIMGEFCIEDCKIPERTRKEFTGWYCDEDCAIPFDGIREYQEELYLYAGWRDAPGFILDEKGYVVGYTDVEHVLTDGIVVLPNLTTCIGVDAEAFDGMEELVYELYIPANIVEIDEAVLDKLENLLYIETDAKNPVYYSVDGILYEKTGRILSIPNGRM